MSSKKCTQTVQAVRNGYQQIRDGVKGETCISNILALSIRGFSHWQINGRMQGFFMAPSWARLDIHSRAHRAIDACAHGHGGHCRSPLYYLGVGGVRLEDVVVVTQKVSAIYGLPAVSRNLASRK